MGSLKARVELLKDCMRMLGFLPFSIWDVNRNNYLTILKGIYKTDKPPQSYPLLRKSPIPFYVRANKNASFLFLLLS